MQPPLRPILLLAGAVLLAPPLRAQPAAPIRLDSLEARFAEARRVADQISITESRGVAVSAHGVELPDLRLQRRTALSALGAALAAPVADSATAEDGQVLAAMRRWYRRTEDAASAPDSLAPSSASADSVPPDCPAGHDATESAASLSASIFGCYGAAAGRIVVGPDTLDRLSIFSLLSTTDDPARRERLFRALDGVWTTVNGHDEPDSPFRRLIPLRIQGWRGPTPMARRGETLGLEGDVVEGWLELVLDAWRATLPDTLFEPWDYYYHTGAASRRLRNLIPRDSLLAINDRYYRDLGADPEPLGVRFDIEPRVGKYPIAFTDFGGRPTLGPTGWAGAEPWVFASYRLGGFDNLNELLHETGHAVHMAAIRTRPALADWPDSDTFTEGIADLASLEMFEPAWQQRYLGASAPLAESLRAKYAWMMLDYSWALFEFRVHRPDAPSPNTVWNEITGRYLRIKPHPELSWWAMRGQLVESPGYMVNYALGAIVVADLRASLAKRYGPFTTGRPDWYSQVSDALYRFGQAKPAADVIRAELGRGPRPEALLADLARIR